MKQRLVLAQALMEKPALLLLDEPTNALDSDGVKMFYDIIAEEKKRGATIVIASHSSEDLSCLCDEVYVLDGGKMGNYNE